MEMNMTMEMTPKISKKEELYKYITYRGFAKTSDVIAWGSTHKSNRADRDARLLAEKCRMCVIGAKKCSDDFCKGKIRRMDKNKAEAIFGYKMKEAVWEVMLSENQKELF